MTAATLGGLIKDHRIRKRLSQLEVSLRIGWKDTTRLSKIEQGRVGTPTRATVDKIIEALELEGPEKGEFLLVGGYLPTEEEIEHIRKVTKETLDNWPYPADIFDFSWRIIDHNKKMIELYQFSKEFNQSIIEKHLNIIELVYSADSKLNSKLKKEKREYWEALLINVTSQFKYEQRTRIKDKWFVSFIKKMLVNEDFRRVWKKIHENKINIETGQFLTKSLINPKDLSKNLNFYLFVIPIVEDIRFNIEVLVPMDLESYKYYSNK